LTIDHPIECYGAAIDDVLLLPTPISPDLYVPLHYTVHSAEPYAHSSLVTITPHVSVVNNISATVFLHPAAEDGASIGEPMAIPAGARRQLLVAATTLSYLFTTDDSDAPAVVLQFNAPIRSTFAALGGRPIAFEVAVLGCEFLVTFGEGLIPQPLMLTNLLDREVRAGQVGFAPDPCPAGATTVLAYRDPFGCTDIHVVVGDGNADVSVVKVNSPIDCGGFFVEVVANDDGTKTIRVSETPVVSERSPGFELTCLINAISISFIDDDLREISLLSVRHIQAVYRTGDNILIALLVKSFQLDDLHPLAPLRVAAAGYPQEDDGYWLSLGATLFRDTPFMTACREVGFTLQPTLLFIDVSFLSDFIFFAQHLFDVRTRFLLDPPKPAVASKLGQRPFTCEDLRIDEIKINIFVRSNTDRPLIYPETVPYLSLIPDITNGEIALPVLAFQDCVMTQAFVSTQIVQTIVQTITRQGLKLLFKIDLFRPSTGTRSSNFARRIERLKSGEVHVLAQMSGSALLHGGESILGGVSKILHTVSFDKGTQISRVNSTARETAIGAGKAIYEGFVRGITGIVMDPIEMKREKGALGVFLGIGKGLIGLVTKPICGILDGGAGALAALRSLVNNEDADVIPPIRIARAFPDWRIDDLTEDEGGKVVAPGGVRFVDVAQFAIQMSKSNRWTRRTELFFKDRRSDEADAEVRWFAFATTKLYVMDHEPKILGKLNYVEIDGVEVSHTLVAIKPKKGETLEFEVADGVVSLQFADWLRSRIALLKVGEPP
jgi:vacuolar protein sorting-associated protein 13A/C